MKVLGLCAFALSLEGLIGRPSQPTGDMPLGVCDPDVEPSHSSLASIGFAPGKQFFCLKSSNHAGSLTCL